MRGRRTYSDYVRDKVDASDKARQFVSGLDIAAFRSDDKTTYAVVRAPDWVGDGQPADEEAVQSADRDPIPSGVRAGWDYLALAPGVALTQAVKRRRGRQLERIDVRATIGALAEQPDAVHLERLNGCRRDRLGCLTRKTHAFAKDDATWDAAFGLALFEHNWLRPQIALRQPLAEPTDVRRYHRRTPAMALGLSDHPWTMAEFLTRPAYHHH